jgi:hypothetical protein
MNVINRKERKREELSSFATFSHLWVLKGPALQPRYNGIKVVQFDDFGLAYISCFMFNNFFPFLLKKAPLDIFLTWIDQLQKCSIFLERSTGQWLFTCSLWSQVAQAYGVIITRKQRQPIERRIEKESDLHIADRVPLKLSN